MAVHGFRGLGWLLCVAIVAPTCYMVNSHGAAERARLKAMQLAIINAHKDIRALETEFDTRANMAQIERWNGDVLAMNAPQPQQYLASASGLAALDQPAAPAASTSTGGARVETATLVIPTGMRPVETAAVTPAPVPASAPAPAKVAAAATKPALAAPTRLAQRDSQPEQDLGALMRKVDRARLATPDRPLLSAATMNDLRRVAKREQAAPR